MWGFTGAVVAFTASSISCRVCFCLMLTVLVQSSYSYVWLFATLWTIAHQAPLSMGILQGGILECALVPSSRGSSQPRNQTHISGVLLHCRQVVYPLPNLGSQRLSVRDFSHILTHPQLSTVLGHGKGLSPWPCPAPAVTFVLIALARLAVWAEVFSVLVQCLSQSHWVPGPLE